MKKTCVFIFKVIILILLILLLGIGLTIIIGTLQEKPPEHLLDFQDIKKTVLDKPVNTVEDGLPYALNEAHEWRQDAVLTGLEIVSVGKEEIGNNKGKLRYILEFTYIDESKPSGIMFISINTNSNSIEFVSASHDGEAGARSFSELKCNNLTECIKKVYDVAIKAIGKENIFQYEQPFVRVHVDSNYATFEVSSSQAEPNIIKNRVIIDMKTYGIVKPTE